MHKVREYKKKMRRQAKKMKNNAMAHSIFLSSPLESAKEVGIPNSYPFKEQVLDEERREKEQQKLERQERRRKLRGEAMNAEDDGLEEVKIGRIIRPVEASQAKKQPSQKKKTRKEYSEELDAIIEESEVILFVLDARVPFECRSKNFEGRCTNKNKELILILNKSDLVPKQVVKNWRKELSKEHPTVSFSSITSNCEDIAAKIRELNKGTRIGIIGYPNTGKKTLLDRLNKSSIENLQLPNKVGTILGKQNPDSLIIKAVADLDDVGDPYILVHALLKQIPKEKLLLKYEVPEYRTTQEFLEHVSRSRRLLLKGGVTDYDRTAREVLADWVYGRIQFYQEP
eukprot:TRINITY_DN2392_c0_g3_i10.p1 TRINITY_DN2392_c0_g3~~TRINITY_DN2392_c0_g3_i10.p1  ORF type:complete len:342 (-),score=118.35 TRINITY_DN2392_c0_g3_i10:44-1069(-)